MSFLRAETVLVHSDCVNHPFIHRYVSSTHNGSYAVLELGLQCNSRDKVPGLGRLKPGGAWRQGCDKGFDIGQIEPYRNP